MNIDIDINEMFSEKNQTIFLNKLLMDLDNNTESFKLATKNIVMVEIAKLFSSLKRVYNKYSITYEENEIKKLFSSTKSKLLDNINVVIDEKASANKMFVNNSRESKIKRSYIEDYHKHIDDSERTFEETIKLVIQEDTEIGLYNSLINLYPCSNEEMQQDIMHIINVDCCHSIVSRVIDEGKHRSMTLKNISEETYQKYLDLSRNSDTIQKKPKVKKPTEN